MESHGMSKKTTVSTTSLFRKHPWPYYKHRHFHCPGGSSLGWAVMQLLLLCTDPQDPVPGTGYSHSHVPALFCWLGQQGNQIQSSEQSHVNGPGLTPWRCFPWHNQLKDMSSPCQRWFPRPFCLNYEQNSSLSEFIKRILPPAYFWM